MARRPVAPTLPFPPAPDPLPIRVVYTRLGTAELLKGPFEITFQYPRVLVRFLRGLRGAVDIVSITEAPIPQTAALAFQSRTKQERQERLSASGNDDV